MQEPSSTPAMNQNISAAQNLDLLNQMPDDQLKNMVNMMRANPGMLRSQYEAMHGMKLSDE